jgi:hypothetical protein
MLGGSEKIGWRKNLFLQHRGMHGIAELESRLYLLLALSILVLISTSNEKILSLCSRPHLTVVSLTTNTGAELDFVNFFVGHFKSAGHPRGQADFQRGLTRRKVGAGCCAIRG